jgi:hypothetical protein
MMTIMIKSPEIQLEPRSCHITKFTFPVLRYASHNCFYRCCRVLTKKIVTLLVKTFPAFYGTRNFIIMFIRAYHWTLTSARQIQSTTSHPVSSRFTLILSSSSMSILPSGPLPSGFQGTNTMHSFLLSAPYNNKSFIFFNF